MLQVKSISFSYSDKKTISNCTFSIKKGSHVALIGESGCGKSTLLKLVYGLYDLDEGEILWNKKTILGPKFNLIPGMDFMKYLAQDFDLMPFITVAENVGKYLSNLDLEKKWSRVRALLEVVEMQDFFDTKAKYLSGGQMQRVAIARVLALEPEVLLLDEPFSHIDNFRKNSLRRKLFSYLKQNQITCLFASHDSNDVLSFANEVLVIKDGKIIVKDTPNQLYTNPKSYYTASLFGDVNEIEKEGKINFVYPNQLQIVNQSNLKVEIIHSYFKGSHFLIESNWNGKTIFFENEKSLPVGYEVFIDLINSKY